MGDHFVSWIEKVPEKQRISFTTHFFFCYMYLFQNFEKVTSFKNCAGSDVGVIHFSIFYKTMILIFFYMF